MYAKPLFLFYGRLFTFAAAFIAAVALRFSRRYEDGIAAVTHTQRCFILCHHEAEHHLQTDQQEKISFKVSELRDFFPRHYTAAQMMQEIILAAKERQQRLARQRDRDAR